MLCAYSLAVKDSFGKAFSDETHCSGTVYRGTQRSTNRTVAIKRIPYADSTPEGGVPCNVIREISLLRELTHSNVVQLLDVIQASPGGLYLVFEYVAHDLKTYMDQRQRSEDIRERIGLPKPMVQNFLRQILEGVGYCHTHRVLHRDLKPHNVSRGKSAHRFMLTKVVFR